MSDDEKHMTYLILNYEKSVWCYSGLCCRSYPTFVTSKMARATIKPTG